MFAKERNVEWQNQQSYEEQMLEMERREQESQKKQNDMQYRKKEDSETKKAEESKKNEPHRLCQIGGAVESVLGAPIEEEDIQKLIGFLKRQEANGENFSKSNAERDKYRYGGSVMAGGMSFHSFIAFMKGALMDNQRSSQ